MHGLYAGLDQLLTPTQTQNEKRIALLENADSLQNNGRIICITVGTYVLVIRFLWRYTEFT